MSKSLESPSSDPQKQSTISSFFSQQVSQPSSKKSGKRPQSPIDLTSEPEGDVVARPHKRTKTHLTPSSHRGESRQDDVMAFLSQEGSRHAEQWRFDPAASSDVEHSQSHTAELENQKLREKAKKILLGHDVFSSPSQLDEAEHREVLDGASESDQESDQEFLEYMKTFSVSKVQKGAKKGTSSPSKRRTSPEVGPSGQTYTPLELQVCHFHFLIRRCILVCR